MEKGDNQNDEIIETSRARYVLNAKTDEEELLFDKLEIIRINMKDPQTKKQIFKNRRDQGIQILREYVEKNQRYLTIQSPNFLSLNFLHLIILEVFFL